MVARECWFGEGVGMGGGDSVAGCAEKGNGCGVGILRSLLENRSMASRLLEGAEEVLESVSVGD